MNAGTQKGYIYELLESLGVTCGIDSLDTHEGPLLEKALFMQYGIDLTPAVDYFSKDVPQDASDIDKMLAGFRPLIDVTIEYLGIHGYSAKSMALDPIVKAEPKRNVLSKIAGTDAKGNTIFIRLYDPKQVRVYISDIDVMDLSKNDANGEQTYQRIQKELKGGTATLIVTYGRFLSSVLNEYNKAIEPHVPKATANKSFHYSSIFQSVEAI